MGVGDTDNPPENTVTIRESDGFFVARDEETGVSSQGTTKAEALANLSDALETYYAPPPEDFDENLEPASAPWFE